MHREYTAVVKQEGDWWIGWVEEVPGVNCQERSHAELMASLQVTLREALELNRDEDLQAGNQGNHGGGSVYGHGSPPRRPPLPSP